jgi:hypothetical protein
MIASLRRIWKQTPPGLRREVSHLKPTFGPPQGRPSLCRLVDQRTGQQADGLLMSPTADPEERAQKLDRQLVVLVRRLALQPYEEISDVHVERPGNGMEPTRCDAISPQFVLVLLLVTDANQHRQSLLGHPDKDALYSDPSPHMSIGIGRADAPRDSLTGGWVVGRSISGLRLEGCPAHQSCCRYRRVARFHSGLARNEPTGGGAESRKGRILLESASMLP